MKAVQINRYGGIDVLEVNDVSRPSVSKGQVLVEVHAASINPFDWKVREGYVKDFMPLVFPATMGGDFAGKVVEGSAKFKVGDEVYGQAAVYGGGSGVFAQFAVANVGKIANKPKNINFEQSASLPLVGVSALQAIETHIKLKKGQKILIHGGAGGIGSIAVQVAKAVGAYVVTTASGDDKDFVKGLGADDVIDYKTEDFADKVRGFDAVFDTAGGETTNKSFGVVKGGGIVVWMAGEPDLEIAKKFGVLAIAQNTEGNADRLNRLCELVENGKVKPQVDRVFVLDQVKEAFNYQEKDHPRGKVVLKITD